MTNTTKCSLKWSKRADKKSKIADGRHFETKSKNLAPYGTDGRLLLSGFQLLVTLTLTLDRVIRHTVVHHSSTFIYIGLQISLKLEKRFCGRTNRRDRTKFKVM